MRSISTKPSPVAGILEQAFRGKDADGIRFEQQIVHPALLFRVQSQIPICIPQCVQTVEHEIENTWPFLRKNPLRYQPFPDPLSYRIRLEQLRDEKVRQRLKLIWTDPATLDPSKRSAEVTRDVANYLAELAKSFEKAGHPPKAVAEFLTRCLFCMFAEDVGLLPNGDGKPGFSALLNSLRAQPDSPRPTHSRPIPISVKNGDGHRKRRRASENSLSMKFRGRLAWECGTTLLRVAENRTTAGKLYVSERKGTPKYDFPGF